jgi:phage host-nuclease inhibitor protein Gam
VNTASDDKKRAGKAAASEAAPEAAAVVAPDELGRIRDILFGQQVRAYDARLKALEQRTQQDDAELRTDVTKRLASLEDYVKAEVNALGERLKTEQDERYRAVRQVAKELREGLEAIDKRLTAAAAQAEAEFHVLREQVLQYSQAVRDELRAAAGESASLPH